ncbi:hypothetical protein FACS1894159_05410 [Bacteroidia bacterium]|nr:hypothetical protein FACS1894159_05410 [Bacteroidia bacterium]
MKKIFFALLLAVAALSCTRVGMDYTIEHKQLNIEQAMIFIDGFLQNNVPVYQGTPGDPDDPADRLAIPVTSAFGKNLKFVFLDKSDRYGFKIKSGYFQTADNADKQYAYFAITGTPTITSADNGVVPISFDVLDEDGNSMFGTITKTIPVWKQTDARPPREQIPTAEKPFVFIKAEVNFVNQDNISTPAYIYAMKSWPTTSFVVNGVTYNTSVNIRYHSILINSGALIPEFTPTEVSGVTQNILTIIYPTAENLAEHPDWFVLSDGFTTSSPWATGDQFMHGKNSKPIAVGMYNPLAANVTSGANVSRPFSSLTWNITTKSGTNPKGTYVSQPGRYKMYIKYINNDSANDFAQYLPEHPSKNGEHGWVPYEFEVKPNPMPGLALNPAIDNADWQPTATMPIKMIRADVVKNDVAYSFPATVATPNASVHLRFWFAHYREPNNDAYLRYSFKLQNDANVTAGFSNSDVEAAAGAGAKFGGGTASKWTDESTHYFADPAINDQFLLSYVDFWVASGAVFPAAGTFDLTGEIKAGSGDNTPKFPYDQPIPVQVSVTP